ncbi:preprotein translocase subunit SecE [bacterium]|uniref:Protein translocase subunit SecE n=2 Tax=Katanobacteria TaxID=422282 RepID=A0A2M7X3W6_UNCKA|nr:preprotein translocase subunit SecE [bacterium]PIP56987.1 MAG: preprotein translocase subunit SecE [candidate division WWE3 bacterium CG22_combo_CG10-13_8_21_14_all_39_12]PJA40875.1 MAG: preprotein translocase subunit SecE [candidate division WWE3 bacterium CG_4_9_14_3_um_filter_39_7]
MNTITTFVYDVRNELYKVKWPTREHTLKMTLVVIITTVGIGIYVGAIDFGLTAIIEKLLIL